MNRTTLRMLCVAGFALVGAACSQGNGTPGSEGGSSSGGASSAGGASSTGGSVGTGGSTVASGGVGATNAGGTPNTGGVNNTGGANPSGGVTGAGGANPSGGATPSGGVTKLGGATGSGGTTGAGGVTKSGGATGSGGTTGAGGATNSGGSASSGGATKTGGVSTSGGATTSSGGTTTSSGGATGTGGAGGGTTPSPDTITSPSLNGYFWLAQCSDLGAATGTNCPDFDSTGQCPNASATNFDLRGMSVTHVLTVGGTPGTTYTINFLLRGVLGTECYTGGTTTAGATTQPVLSTDPETSNNGWYMGGSPVASKWNTYEIHVKPAVGTLYLNPLDNTENIYYLNAFPQTPAGWCEKEGSFPINYSAKFQVTGGGTITLRLHDSNCLTQQNCGPISTKTCSSGARTIDLTGMPAVPNQTLFSSMTQPYKQTNGWYPQWAFFEVTSVTSP